MPINTNGSFLEVTTNVGGEQVNNEDQEYQRYLYGRNQQRERQKQCLEPLSKMPPPPPPKLPKAKAKPTKADKAVELAHKKDLRKRNIKN